MGHDRGGPLVITPLAPAHLRAIDPQPAQRSIKAVLALYGEALWVTPEGSWTAWSPEMQIIACGGLVPMWEGCASAWSILSADAGLHFLRLHRTVLMQMEQSTYRRIQATVDQSFEEGHRWIQALGFHYEGTMTGYNPDGTDACLYARIR